MKITEAARKRMAWEMVEEISTDAESLNPRKTWRRSHEAVCLIYELAHSIRSPKCRKNHPAWVEKIDAAIRSSRRKK